MKNVVMKYLDNLIEWGDQLFRRDSIESITEATQLYIRAAEILGRRPELLPPEEVAPKTFEELRTAPPGPLLRALRMAENTLQQPSSFLLGMVAPAEEEAESSEIPVPRGA